MIEINEKLFVVDSMSGKLAKWIRILGYSVEYVDPGLDDPSVLGMLKGRVLITRDSELSRKALKMGYKSFEVPQDMIDAIAILSSELGISLKIDARRTRCPFCDEPLSTSGRSGVSSELPREVLRGHRRFLVCKSCGKIFWFGSHYWKMLETLARVKKRVIGNRDG